MRTLTRVGALSAVAAAAVLAVPAAAAHAAGSGDGTYTVQLRQDLPRTATTDDGGAPQQDREECPGVPEGKDGWHFVLPGNSSDFVKLTVTFEPGGQQVVTSFGPPSDKHAYVASQPGAELTSAVAEVRGGDLKLFNLSHTCPVTDGPTPTESAEPTGGTSSEPSTSEPSQEPSQEPSATPSEDASPSEGGGGSASPTASSSPSAPGGGGSGGGDLAETGNGAPVGLISGAAAALLAAGGYLVFRRRRAAGQG